jgi:hypothetical protein
MDTNSWLCSFLTIIANNFLPLNVALNYTMESGFIKTLAFIDESGNTDLDTSKLDVSKYFIVCAVIIDDERSESMKQEVDSIRKNISKQVR